MDKDTALETVPDKKMQLMVIMEEDKQAGLGLRV